MSTDLAVKEPEVLEPGSLDGKSLDELAAIIRCEIVLAERAAGDALRHAIARWEAAKRALERQEREGQAKQAARKAGGAEQELYAMAERMQDIMGQAHREATDREKRRHYALAGEHYRKMRDEIVRALGVA